MKLPGNSFPISFKLEDVTELIESLLKEKNWSNFEVAEASIVFEPYFVFYYDTYSEEQSEEQGEAIVTATERGRLAFSAVSAEIDEAVAASMPNESELVREIEDEYPVQVHKPVMNAREARRIAQIKAAEYLGKGRNQIIISNMQLAYYPMWYVGITVAGNSYALQVSGVDGTVFGEEAVPVREKGFVEITQETLQELKQPNAWLRYSKQAIGVTVSAATNVGLLRRIGHVLLHNRMLQLVIAVLIIIYLIVFVL